MNNNGYFLAAALLFSVLISSCMKKPDHNPNYGPEVAYDDIVAASKVDMPTSPEMIKKGQYVSIDWYNVIETYPPQTFFQRNDEVTESIEKTATGGGPGYCWKFKVVENQLMDAASNTWKKSETNQGPLSYPSIHDTDCTDLSSLKSSHSAQKSSVDLKNFSLKGLRLQDKASTTKVTYHNLKREDGFTPVPQSVSKKTDCGGVKNCAQGLRFVRISFDRVVWTSESKGQKVTYRFTYSSDIPTYIYDWLPGEIFLTNQLESCAMLWKEFKNGDVVQNVPIRECMEVTDFQFGK
jgi:hypothetical protein